MLAQISDTAVLSAIVVYALAMLCYAAETAMQSRARPRPDAQAAATLGAAVPVTVGAAPAMDRSAVVEDAGGAAARPAGRRVGRVAVALTVVALAIHVVGFVSRGLAAGRAPWGNMYEFAVAAAMAAAVAYLVVLRRHPVRGLGVWVVGLVTLTLGLAVTVLYAPAGALVPALNSYWLVIHVAAAIVAGGMFTVGAALTVLFLLRQRVDGRDAAVTAAASRRGYLRQLPEAAALQSLAQAAHVFAFPIWTFAVIAGAIWAEDSWGRYWGWDPKETWAFITWVLYAAYLHAQSTAGWRGRRSAWFALAGYLAFLFNFFGVNLWVNSLHSYAGV